MFTIKDVPKTNLAIWQYWQGIPRTVWYDNDTGINVIQLPIDEINQLRGSKLTKKAVHLPPGSVVPVEGAIGDQVILHWLSIVEYVYKTPQNSLPLSDCTIYSHISFCWKMFVILLFEICSWTSRWCSNTQMWALWVSRRKIWMNILSAAKGVHKHEAPLDLLVCCFWLTRTLQSYLPCSSTFHMWRMQAGQHDFVLIQQGVIITDLLQMKIFPNIAEIRIIENVCKLPSRIL